MPKGFTERERAIIRTTLHQQGRALFATYGLRKTNIDDLTRAVGISKGAFYLFYDSKEELFFELLEQYEADSQAAMLKAIAEGAGPARERLQALLRHVLRDWKENALFAKLPKEEFEQLFRKLPEARMQSHLSSDDAFAVEFIEAWRKTGVEIAAEPHLVAGLIRALFFISMHEEDFGADMYSRVIDVYIALLAGYLVDVPV